MSQPGDKLRFTVHIFDEEYRSQRGNHGAVNSRDFRIHTGYISTVKGSGRTSSITMLEPRDAFDHL